MIGKRALALTIFAASLASLGACSGDSGSSSTATSTAATATASAPATAPASTQVTTVSSTKTATTTSSAASSASTSSSTGSGSTGSGSTGSGSSGTGTSPTATIVKSIKQWVSCSETIDESNQLAAALVAAANNAFVLQIDCPVRLHTGVAANASINVPDGVTLKFTGSGEFLTGSNLIPALSIAHAPLVTFVDYNQAYL